MTNTKEPIPAGDYIFNLKMALDFLGGSPSQHELERATHYYDAFNEKAHRGALLKEFFANETVENMVKTKLQKKNIDGPLSNTSEGGHSRWAVTKARKYVWRLLYLRIRLDGETDIGRIKANRTIFHVPHLVPCKQNPDGTPIAKDMRSNLRKATHCKMLGD